MSLAGLLEPHATVTVAGLAKNAGKTTVMNHLLASLEGPFGLASLGLDGEARDQLTGLAKPRVRPPAGALVATAESLAGDAPVRARLGMRTSVGEVMLVESTGEPVIVSGPARLDELDRTLDALRALGVRRILLEGAVGRLGTAAPGRADAVVLAAGASLANGPDDYALRAKLVLDALDLSCTADPADVTVRHAAGFEEETAALVPAGGSAELQGALTGPLLERLLRVGTRCTLVVADATRVLARPQQVARARRGGVEVLARRPLAIAAVTSSPFRPDRPLDPGEAFSALSDAAAGRWPVVDVVSGRISE